MPQNVCDRIRIVACARLYGSTTDTLSMPIARNLMEMSRLTVPVIALNKTADLHADALITTEKDAVRFPRFETTPVPCYYLRVDIEILKGAENFATAVDHICNVKPKHS